jgi:hypothetical protein
VRLAAAARPSEWEQAEANLANWDDDVDVDDCESD